jgi:hypothetical protein
MLVEQDQVEREDGVLSSVRAPHSIHGQRDEGTIEASRLSNHARTDVKDEGKGAEELI